MLKERIVNKLVRPLRELPSVQLATFALPLPQRRYPLYQEQVRSVPAFRLHRIVKLARTVQSKRVKRVFRVPPVTSACHLQMRVSLRIHCGLRSLNYVVPLLTDLTTPLFFSASNAQLEQCQQNLLSEIKLCVSHALKGWCVLLKDWMIPLNHLLVPKDSSVALERR